MCQGTLCFPKMNTEYQLFTIKMILSIDLYFYLGSATLFDKNDFYIFFVICKVVFWDTLYIEPCYTLF